MNCGWNCEIVLVCTNVLCGVKTGCCFNLDPLVKSLGNIVFDPKKMRCVVWRHRQISCGKPVALVFESGYISVNGNSTVSQACRNTRQFMRILQKHHGYKIYKPVISIQAISATCKIPKNYKLKMQAIVECFDANYEPEIMQACVLKKAGITYIIFPSGSIVITGMKNTYSSLENVCDTITEMLILCS